MADIQLDEVRKEIKTQFMEQFDTPEKLAKRFYDRKEPAILLVRRCKECERLVFHIVSNQEGPNGAHVYLFKNYVTWNF